MSTRACVCGLLVACACGSVLAGSAPSLPQAAEPGGPCPPPPQLSSWADREEVIRQHGELPASCLKALLRECTQASEQAMLDGDQAITCSIRYEALLRHGFGGNFDALLAWWRAER